MDNQIIRSCVGCRHYYVTWDPKTPKGCRFFGFKSVQMPCLLVLKTTGEGCPEYKQKDKEGL